MTAFDFTGTAATTLEAYDAGWEGDSTLLELDGSGSLQAVNNDGAELYVWFTGAFNDVTITEGLPLSGNDIYGPSIFTAANQPGYRCHVNLNPASDDIVDVRLYKNGSLWGANIIPTIDRAAGVPLSVRLYLDVDVPTVVLDNGTTTETLTWPADPEPLTTGNGGLFLNPNTQKTTTRIGSWQDNAPAPVTFAITGTDTVQPVQGDQIEVFVAGGDGTATWQLGNVAITPDSQTAQSAFLTIPDFSVTNGTRPWDTPITLRATQGGLISDLSVSVSSVADQVFTIAGYTHTQNGGKLFDAADPSPANNIVNGDQAEVTVTAGAATVAVDGTVSATTLPATVVYRIYHASTGTWGAETTVELEASIAPFNLSIEPSALTFTGADVSIDGLPITLTVDPAPLTFTGGTIDGNFASGLTLLVEPSPLSFIGGTLELPLQPDLVLDPTPLQFRGGTITLDPLITYRRAARHMIDRGF